MNVTPQQLQAAIDAIKEDIKEDLREGFKAVADRLDDTNEYLRELNGRTRKNEDGLARHDERLKTLFEIRRRRSDDPDDDDHSQERARTERGNVTQRDVRMILAGAGAVGGLLGILKVAWPHLVKAFGP